MPEWQEALEARTSRPHGPPKETLADNPKHFLANGGGKCMAGWLVRCPSAAAPSLASDGTTGPGGGVNSDVKGRGRWRGAGT